MAIWGSVAGLGSNLLSKQSSSGGGGTGLSKVLNPFMKKGLSGTERVQRVFDPFGLFGGGDDDDEEEAYIPQFYLPECEPDPLYTESQDYLYGYGTNLLEGNINNYYAPIGEYGAQPFQDILGLATRDIQRSVQEDLVRRGIGRGGIGSTAVSQKVGDVSKELLYNDYARAIEGRESLLNAGLNTVSGVRTSALNLTGMKSQADIARAKLELEGQNLAWQMEQAENAQEGNLFSDVLGTAANLYGNKVLGDILGKDTGFTRGSVTANTAPWQQQDWSINSDNIDFGSYGF